MSTRIAHYHFEDSKRNLIVVAVLHALFCLMFLLPESAVLAGWGRGQLCGLIALAAALLYWQYDWRSVAGNAVALLSYVALLFLEYQQFGLPGDVVKISSVSVSKGALLDHFLNLLPPVYVALRVVCVGVIVWVMASRPRDKALA